MSSSTLQTAIAAVHSGDKETAQRLLAQLIRDDPQNEAAWLWMSSVTDSDEDRRHCLDQVLTINPHNETAQRGLEALSQMQVSEPSQAQKQLGLPLLTAVTPLQQIRKLQEQAAATERKRLTVTSPTKKGALTLLIVLAIVTVVALCVAFVLTASTAQ